MKSLKTLEKNVEKLEKSLATLDVDENLLKMTEKDFVESMVTLADTMTPPDSEDGTKLLSISDMIRKLGSKLMNLLKIEFSISFAGVTIVHFVIPKLDKNLNVRKDK